MNESSRPRRSSPCWASPSAASAGATPGRVANAEQVCRDPRCAARRRASKAALRRRQWAPDGRRSRACSSSPAIRRGCRPTTVNKDEAVCKPGGKAPAAAVAASSTPRPAASPTSPFIRAASSRVHESAEPGTEPLVFDQKDCVFLTHVMGLTVGHAGADQEQRSSAGGTQYEHPGPAEQVQPDDPRGRAGDLDGDARGGDARRRPLQRCTPGWWRTCCRERTSTSR